MALLRTASDQLFDLPQSGLTRIHLQVTDCLHVLPFTVAVQAKTLRQGLTLAGEDASLARFGDEGTFDEIVWHLAIQKFL